MNNIVITVNMNISIDEYMPIAPPLGVPAAASKLMDDFLIKLKKQDNKCDIIINNNDS
ncbi:hypothetical protein GCM10007898_12800 [Dyella flagellata]|uniref:Uncharacterized protein n=1 Tax=Dyella flagellata TaxID=1867833 RepID=A0ABQ5X9H3_9GAMM|nr:hypothetical protein GCM10007898_12800 [Dyella flagellata]